MIMFGYFPCFRCIGSGIRTAEMGGLFADYQRIQNKKGEFSMANEETKTLEFSAEDQKKLKQLKVAYPIQQLGGGIEKAYLSTYLSYLYTNVYMMPAAFSGLISIIQSVVGWIGGPVFGALIDKVSFKNAKYYPWMIIGPTIYYLAWLLVYALPVFGVVGYAGAVCALVLAILIALVGPLVTVPINAVYPNMSADPGDRQYFALMQKIGRDGGKTIFGYIFPIMIPALALTFSGGAAEATARGEQVSYALCAIVATVPPILGFLYYAFCLKGSYVERNAMKKAKASKKSLPMSVMFKSVFANRPLLGMFLFMGLHKSFYFIYTGCAVYMFKYVFGDFSKMSIFMTLFNLTAIVGVTLGPIWKKIFKETKRCFVSAFLVHFIVLIIIALTFKSLPLMGFMILFAISSLFMGMLENYILPMFAASADYGAWKNGERTDGLTMSIYSLTIKTGTLVSTTIRTAVLVAAGLDAITAGGPVTDHFVNTMSAFWTWGPVALATLSLASLLFIFNLNDEKIKWINDDLKAGILAKDSVHKF